jgi:hypothetical protein
LEVLGIEWRKTPSALTGGTRITYTGARRTWTAPKLDATVPGATAKRPRAYWVPAAWGDVIERLELQGVRLERQASARSLEVEMYRIQDPKLASEPFEGRVAVSARFAVERRRETYAPGTARVPLDQPLGDLAMLLLEPASPDSFFAWGFFHEILRNPEYVEAYVMEPMAERMLAEDPALRAEFERELREDAAFGGPAGAKATDREPFVPRASARLQWFYERTPYFDERALLYPVGREP